MTDDHEDELAQGVDAGVLRARLAELAGDAFTLLEDARGVGIAVEPSHPILYFGDSIAYAASRCRIVTVGLNPSDGEFPAAAPWSRFPQFPALAPGDVDGYLRGLDAYFHVKPYTTWFGPSYGPLLDGLGAAYGPGAASTALHTDVCSPVATKPTWSKLSPPPPAPFTAKGVELWRRLVDALRPDVVLMSVRADMASTGLGVAPTTLPVIATLGKTKPLRIHAGTVQIGGARPLVVFGRGAQLPLGTVSAADKRELGRRVAALVEGGEG